MSEKAKLMWVFDMELCFWEQESKELMGQGVHFMEDWSGTAFRRSS